MKRQGLLEPQDALGLKSQRLGPLPLINHFLKRLDIEARLDSFVATDDGRVRLPYAKGLGVLVRSILVEREPVYRQAETVSTFAPEAFGLTDQELSYLSDDAVGRALDHLFDADRALLVTDLVVAITSEFGVSLAELHNDSTTVSFCGKSSQSDRQEHPRQEGSLYHLRLQQGPPA